MAFRAEAHTLHSPATHRPAPHGKVSNYQPAEYVRYTNDAPTPPDDWQLPLHGYYPTATDTMTTRGTGATGHHP